MLRALGRFLLFMQKPNGGFYSKYIPSGVGRDDRWVSLYYPGEAALGLVMLHRRTGDREWLRGAKRALLYLARRRARKRRVLPDHWALIATRALFELPNPALSGRQRNALKHHAKQVVKSLLSGEDSAEEPWLHGSFGDDGRTTPAATRLEGLIAALAVLDAGPVRARALRATADLARFLIRAQRLTAPEPGAVPRAIRPLTASHPRATPSFNRRALEVRIDYVQHALSGWLGYLELLTTRGATSRAPRPAPSGS